jgi:hypothetical protein
VDGDPVTGEPSDTKDAAPVSLTETFMKLCPAYMVMGMTYDEFWNCNTKVHKAYREAYEIKQRNAEWARHRQGAYFFNALMCAAPVMRAAFGKGEVKPGKYPDEPWPLTEKEAREQQKRREEENFKQFLAQMEKSSQAELKRREEEAKMKEARENGRD